LALWAVVIVAGFAYLTVIKEKGSEEGSDEGMAQLAAEVQVREMASRNGSTTEAAPIESAQPTESSAQTPPVVSREDKPAAEAGLPFGEAIAPGALGAEPEKPKLLYPPGVAESAVPVLSPVPDAAEAAPAANQAQPVSAPVPASAISLPVVPSVPVAPEYEGAQASTGVAEGRLQREVPSPAAPVATPQPARASAAGVSAVPDALESRMSPLPYAAEESYERQRARIMAEYEAKQRQYQERMRRYWELMGRPRTRPERPYGTYPGYAPGYYPRW
ncbi:MAG: hypothetical protein LJE70_13015, partial [Chromatiaceae bacterium]|nr:hypothetical protein [Chromatiaceae bacterium]